MLEPSLPSAVRFEDLIAPVTARDFTDHYLEKKPLVLSRREPRYYRSLLSLGDVDSLMHVLKDKPGDVLTLVAPPESGRKTVRRSLRDIRMSEIYSAFGSGDTVCLNGIQGSWPPLVDLKQDMSRALGATVFMNLYLTPASSQGFPFIPTRTTSSSCRSRAPRSGSFMSRATCYPSRGSTIPITSAPREKAASPRRTLV